MINCLFVLFSQLINPVIRAESTTGTYSASKMSAQRYQRAMQQFSSALQGGGLGTWLRKPPKLGHFTVSVSKTER